MSTEIEAKLSVDSHAPVRERLRALDATHLEAVRETNLIFDRADGTLRRSGCGLRIRSSAGADGVRTTMTFKGPTLHGPLKHREEIEVDIGDADTSAALLDRLGFVVILRYEKNRESWSCGTCRVELDEPPQLGLFVEIEGPSEADIQTVQRELGLGDIPHTRASYERMLIDLAQQTNASPPEFLLGES